MWPVFYTDVGTVFISLVAGFETRMSNTYKFKNVYRYNNDCMQFDDKFLQQEFCSIFAGKSPRPTAFKGGTPHL